MKYTKLALACAAALSGQAFALTPATTPDVTLYMSGASAPTVTAYQAVRNMCNGNGADMHAYIGGTSVVRPGETNSSNFFAYFCTLKNTGSYPALDGKKALIYHSVDGGSFNSIGPVLDTTGTVQFPIKFLKDILATATSGCSAAPAGNNADGIPTYTACGNATRARPAVGVGASDGGFSDVEAAIFQDQLATLDASDLNVGGLTSIGALATQTFGIAVSNDLYKAMQDAEKAAGKMDSTCATGDFTPGKCQPNISREQYQSIASNSGGYHTDWAPIVGAAGSGKNVHLCRRVDTSGTQASSNVFFMQNPCARGVLTGGELVPANASNTTPTFIVTENSSTGNVKTCLNNATTAAAADKFRIGVVSAENIVGGSDSWHFVKVDGVSPNARKVLLGSTDDNADGLSDGWAVDAKQRRTTIDGDYNFAMELVINWVGDAGGVKDQFFGQLQTVVSDPLDPSRDLTGISINPLSGYDNPTYPAQVHKGTRFGNSCTPFQLFY